MPDSPDTPTARGDPWGPFRHSVEEAVDTCADYLHRLQRSVRGEIAPDRFYFHEKATYLQTAATTLARLAQNIERWSGECAIELTLRDKDGPYSTDAPSPPATAAPTTAPKAATPPATPPPNEPATSPTASTPSPAASPHLGPEIDHRHPTNHHEIPDQRADIHELKADVDDLTRQATVLSRTLTAADQQLAADHQLATRQTPGPEPLGR